MEHHGEDDTFHTKRISQVFHSAIKIQLIKRFVQFHKTLTKCDKPHLRYLAKLQEVDHRSVFGRNIINICKEAKVEKICDVNIDTFEYFPISEEEEWKVPFMVELLEMLAGKLDTDLSKDDIEDMIDHVATA